MSLGGSYQHIIQVKPAPFIDLHTIDLVTTQKDSIISKTLVIAEAGVNHNGDIKKAKKLIDFASNSGADIVNSRHLKLKL